MVNPINHIFVKLLLGITTETEILGQCSFRIVEIFFQTFLENADHSIREENFSWSELTFIEKRLTISKWSEIRS